MGHSIFPDVAPLNLSIGLRGNTRTNPSPSAAVSVTTFRPGAAWALNATFGILGDSTREERARLNRASSFVNSVQETRKRFWYYPRQHPGGEVVRGNLLAAGSGYLQSNRLGAELWTTIAVDGGSTLAVNSYRLEIRGNAGTGAEQQIAVTDGMTYSLTGEYHIDPRVGSTATLRVGSTSEDNNLLNVSLTADDVGRFTYTFVASGNTAFLSMVSGEAGSIYFSQMAVAPAATVTATAQKGESVARIGGLPGSLDIALFVGDFIEINGEFKQLTTDLETFGAGEESLSFAPSLRKPLAIGDPVILHRPSILVQAADTDVTYQRAGMGTLPLQMVEVFPRSTNP
ncbi:MAG: hypothetical protein AAF184_09690 [Pseudomonadota bacterium]